MILLKFLPVTLVLLCLGTASAFADSSVYHRHNDYILGTSFDLVVVADSEQVADKAEAAMLDEINRLSGILSTYDPGSEISRLNSEGRTTVSSELSSVLQRCESFRQETSNALSCRIGKVLALWREAEDKGVAPDRSALRLAAGQARRADVVIGADAVSRPDAVRFTVDALAKGYIIDQALAAGRAATPSATGLLLNIGGDQLVWGKGPHDGVWRTGISSFSAKETSGKAILSYSAGALATSGTGPRDRVIAGERYGHIISPADGWPVAGKQRASVYAPDAVTADAMATALMVMDISDGLAFVEGLKGVEASILAEDGRIYETSGWEELKLSAPQFSAKANAAWPDGYKLVVDLEIPDLDVPKYERPYVAAWIADPKRNLIRILMLAGDEPRWMEENYYWFHRFGRKAGSLVDAMSGPTRRPGSYTLVWDGLTDDGKAVPPGSYILHVEAAREHGDHQHESLEFELPGDAFSKSVPAGAELGTISVSFGKPQ